MLLFSISWKSIPCMQVNFSRPRVEPVNSMAHATSCLLEGEICAFMVGSWLGFPEGLCNFWEEQLTVAQNCTISRLSSLVGTDCAVFTRKVDWQDCIVYEPIKLIVRIAQFLEGRMVPLHNCAIYWGRCSTCSWTKSENTACEESEISYHAQVGNLLENH